MQRTHFTAGYTLYNAVCDKENSSEAFVLQKHLLLQAHTIQKFEVCKIFFKLLFTKATFICSKIPYKHNISFIPMMQS